MQLNEQPKRSWRKKSSTRILALAAMAAAAAFWLLRPPPAPPQRGSGEYMKAIVHHEFGAADVLRLEETEKLLPNDHQVLIKVRAAAANPLDWHYMRGTPYLMRVMGVGLFKPKDARLGRDLAGEVVEIGKSVTRFKPGDAVFGAGGGAFAEFALASEKNLALKPADITFEDAAAAPVAALTALQGLRDKGRVHRGQKVLINGASGGVGTYAVQIAKSYGAEVTGVCSTRNLDMVRTLGADHVIDYTQEDFVAGEQRYDLILDNVGNRSVADFRRVLAADGILVIIGGGGPQDGQWIGPLIHPLQTLVLSPFVSQELLTLFASINSADLDVLKTLMETGKVRSVIDRTYSLSEVPAAIRYLEEGRARGKVVITVAQD